MRRRDSARALVLVAIALLPLRALAQAEPAPPEYVPPQAHSPLPPPSSAPTEGGLSARWNLAASARLALRIGGAPGGVPVVGYGGGVRLHAALARLGPLRFGLGAHFAYDKFTRDKPAMQPIYTSTSQQLAHASFALLALLDGLFGRVRPWLGAGGGLSVARYLDPTVDGTPPMTIDQVAVVGLVLVATGLDVRVYESFEVGVRGDGEFTFSSNPAFAPGLVAVSLDAGFRF